MKAVQINKLLNLVTILAILLINSSCKKSSTENNSPAIIAKDSLGVGWTKVYVGNNNTGEDIFFINDTTGYLIGYRDFKSSDGGNTWQPLPNSVNGVSCSATSDGKLFILNWSLNWSPTSLYQSTDYGNNFTHAFDSISGIGSAIFFSSNNVCYVATGSNRIYKTTDGGTTWNKMLLPTGVTFGTSLGNNNFMSFYFINDSIGWVGDGLQLYKINSNSNQWTKCIINSNIIRQHISIAANTMNAVYISFLDQSGLAVQKSTDGGVTFNLIGHLPVITGDWNDNYFSSDTNGYISIDNRIFHTTDGGQTWNTVVSLANNVIIESCFTNDKHGWACCDDGSVLVYKQ